MANNPTECFSDSKVWPPDNEPKNIRSCKESKVGTQSMEHIGSIDKVPGRAHNRPAVSPVNPKSYIASLQTLTEHGGYAENDRNPFQSASSKQGTRSALSKKESKDKLSLLRTTVLGKAMCISQREAITYSSMQNQQFRRRGISKGTHSAKAAIENAQRRSQRNR